MDIRPYDVRDRDQVLSVWLAASRVGHPFLTEDDLERQQTLVRDVYLPKAETWVAEEGGRIHGFIGLLGNFIGGLFVNPDRHGLGIGRALVEHAARLKGHLAVDVYAANPIAPSFYHRCGFIETGRKEWDDEGRPFELIRMCTDS
jgi:putative acetyltransferase